MSEYLVLKWGALKGWKLESDATKELMQRYLDQGTSISCMTQRDTEDQKQIICALIDAVDGEIHNDWTGEIMPKDEAKRYVLEYRKPKLPGATAQQGIN